MSQTKIIKYDQFGSPIAEFDIGTQVDLEEYSKDRVELLNDYWPGIQHTIIVSTSDYDGDVDDEGRNIGYPASAWVAVIPRGVMNPFLVHVQINELFKKGELYG